jgi:hypothetical protein
MHFEADSIQLRDAKIGVVPIATRILQAYEESASTSNFGINKASPPPIDAQNQRSSDIGFQLTPPKAELPAVVIIEDNGSFNRNSEPPKQVYKAGNGVQGTAKR